MCILKSESVKSIGTHLDTHMDMNKQISATCKAAWYHLYQVGKIRSYITEDQAKTIIHSHVTSRLDSNNGLLVGLPKKELRRLQLVQNVGARLIKGLRKHDHITPTLRQLHWLPVEQHIVFKVLMMVYKAINFQGPGYLREILTVYTQTRSFRSDTDCKLYIYSHQRLALCRHKEENMCTHTLEWTPKAHSYQR